MPTNAFQKYAISAAITASLVWLPAQDAHAARSGGRVGGRAPISISRPSPRSSAAPSSFGGGARSTTNIYLGGPSIGLGYGYGAYGYGAYDVVGGGNGLGLYMGLSIAEAFIREQQRQTCVPAFEY